MGCLDYVLITPVRNEQDFLPDLAKNLINQTIRPILWVIVDDQSTDHTWAIIDKLQKSFIWIKGIKAVSKYTYEYAYIRYFNNVQKGIEYAKDFCKKNEVNYNFIATVDADVKLELRYFEKLDIVFKNKPLLGVASGIVYEEGMSLRTFNKLNREPRGCALVFRRNLLETIGTYQGDSNLLIKAKNRGFIVETFPTIKVLHRRKTGERPGYFFSKGAYAYYTNYHPINMLLSSIYYGIYYSPLKGFYYLKGYLIKLFLRSQKISDDELKKHYWCSFKRLIYLFYNFF